MTDAPPTDPAALLVALRDAAVHRDWNAARAALRELLSRLPLRDALRLARSEARRRLSAFERQQPGVTWPRQLLDRLDSSELPLDEVTGALADEYEGPGSNNFRNAMEALVAAHRPHSAALVANATDAIAESIMAGMVERWGARNRDAWDRWYRAALSGTTSEEPDALLAMMNDLDVAALERDSWSSLAATLEAALRS